MSGQTSGPVDFILVTSVGLVGSTTGTGKAAMLTEAQVRTLLSVYTTIEVDTLLDGKADLAHTHAIADVTNLQATLDEKLPLSGGTVTAPGAATVALEVKGATTQTADLLEAVDSDGNILVRMGPRVTTANATLLEVNSSKQLVQGSVFRMYGYASSYLDLTQSHDPGLNSQLASPSIRMYGRNNNAGVVTYVSGEFGVTVTGSEKAHLDFMVEGIAGFYVYKHENRTPICGVNSLLTEAQLNVEPNWTGKKGVVVRALAGQAANLFEVQASDGTVEWGIAPGGHVALSGMVSVGGYAFASLPVASSNAGKLLRITDRGQKLAYSDGTNWLFVHDNSVVS